MWASLGGASIFSSSSFSKVDHCFEEVEIESFLRRNLEFKVDWCGSDAQLKYQVEMQTQVWTEVSARLHSHLYLCFIFEEF